MKGGFGFASLEARILLSIVACPLEHDAPILLVALGLVHRRITFLVLKAF